MKLTIACLVAVILVSALYIITAHQQLANLNL